MFQAKHKCQNIQFKYIHLKYSQFLLRLLVLHLAEKDLELLLNSRYSQSHNILKKIKKKIGTGFPRYSRVPINNECNYNNENYENNRAVKKYMIRDTRGAP